MISVKTTTQKWQGDEREDWKGDKQLGRRYPDKLN